MSGTNPSSAVIVISSHVVRGSVGNRAAVFALEALGFPVWAIPTVILPWHPGHGAATRLQHDEEKFARFLDDISKASWIDEVSAVLTGYMVSADQVKQVAAMVKKLKTRKPELVYVCDPVIGDRGGLYVPDQVAEALASSLLPLADIITPNRFELEWLATGKIGENHDSTEGLANALSPKMKLVTSVEASDGRIGNLLIGHAGTYQVCHDKFDRPPNGTGDLTASIFLGRLLAGYGPVQALELTTSSVYETLEHAMQRKSDELMLATDAQSLVSPTVSLAAAKL